MIYELVLGGILDVGLRPGVRRSDAGARRVAGDRVAVPHARPRGARRASPSWAIVARAGDHAACTSSGVRDPALREAQIALGTTLLRWFMPQVIFYGLGAVAAGVLTAHRRFAPPMFAPILNNVAVIVTMGVFIAWGTDGLDTATLSRAQTTLLGLGTTLGVVAMTVALWPALRSLGFRWRWTWDPRDEAVRSLVRLGAWVAVYVAANQLAYFVIITLNNRHRAGLLHGLRAGVRVLLAAPRDRRRLDLHRAPARHGRTVVRRRTRPGWPSSATGGSATPRCSCSPRRPGSWRSRGRSSPSLPGTGRWGRPTRSSWPTRSGRSPSGCRSSRRSSSSRGRPTRPSTAGRRRCSTSAPRSSTSSSRGTWRSRWTSACPGWRSGTRPPTRSAPWPCSRYSAGAWDRSRRGP